MRKIWRDCFQPLIERIHFNAHRFEGRYPSHGSAFASPKIIVPPTVELSGRRRVANDYGDVRGSHGTVLSLDFSYTC